MGLQKKKYRLLKYHLKDDGKFPNNHLPVLLYKDVLDLPALLPAAFIKRLFARHHWSNSWKSGVFTYHHYHSITHEVMGVYKGKTQLMLGGSYGVKITIQKGDVLIIPAGVAHKNLGKENDVKCVGAYPGGRDYDMNYGKPEERKHAIENIKKVPLPDLDPVFGLHGELQLCWKD